MNSKNDKKYACNQRCGSSWLGFGMGWLDTKRKPLFREGSNLQLDYVSKKKEA